MDDKSNGGEQITADEWLVILGAITCRILYLTRSISDWRNTDLREYINGLVNELLDVEKKVKQHRERAKEMDLCQISRNGSAEMQEERGNE